MLHPHAVVFTPKKSSYRSTIQTGPHWEHCCLLWRWLNQHQHINTKTNINTAQQAPDHKTASLHTSHPRIGRVLKKHSPGQQEKNRYIYKKKTEVLMLRRDRWRLKASQLFLNVLTHCNHTESCSSPQHPGSYTTPSHFLSITMPEAAVLPGMFHKTILLSWTLLDITPKYPPKQR